MDERTLHSYIRTDTLPRLRCKDVDWFLVVTSDHRHIKLTCLRDVRERRPPYKFRVRADVVEYTPRAEFALDIIRLFCPVCEFLYVSFSVHLQHLDCCVDVHMAEPTFGISCPLTEFCHVQNSLCVHLRTIAQLSRAISSQLRHLSTIGKNLLSSNTSSTCPVNMVNSAH